MLLLVVLVMWHVGTLVEENLYFSCASCSQILIDNKILLNQYLFTVLYVDAIGGVLYGAAA